MKTECLKLLGLDSGASPEEVKKAFRKKAMALHPDKNKGDASEFRQILQAYRELEASASFASDDAAMKMQAPCPNCYGRGKLFENNPFDPFSYASDEQPCGLCHGKGISTTSGNIPRGKQICPNCQGFGKIADFPFSFEFSNCRKCGGTGFFMI